jgi:hypothetical protein
MMHYKGLINTKPLFILNLLEESREEYEDSLIAMLYYDMYKSDILKGEKSKISKLKLNSYSEDILTEDEFKKIKDEVSPLLDILLGTYYNIEDNMYHPFGLYKRTRDISHKIGTHYYIGLEDNTLPKLNDVRYNKLSKENKKKYKWNAYSLHDDNMYPLVITDHVELITPEKGKDKWESMRDWSFEYCRKQLSKNLKFNVLNIMQQTIYSETKTYSNQNKLNWEALKPSLSDLAGNKVIAQDHHIVFGGFNPYRYASNGTIDGIDLAKSQGRYRSTKILKNRIGEDQIEIPWYFDGAVGEWKELNFDKLQQFYNLCNI